MGGDTFSVAIPGGGQGHGGGCTRMYNNAAGAAGNRGVFGLDVWGSPYGGVASVADCERLPPVLREGCRFRWMFAAPAEAASADLMSLPVEQQMDNPRVRHQRVVCPAALTMRSGCRRR
jgi:hypothetical protein